MRIALSHLKLLLLVVSTVSSIVLLGCGAMVSDAASGADGASLPTSGAVVQGRVHGGNQPVVGASIYLFAASTSGYAAASTSLLCGTHTTLTCGSPGTNVLADGSGNGYVSTDVNGGFTISGNYSCPTGAMVYVLAVGGNPGLGGTVNNSDLAMMAALGSCATLVANASSTFINLNEVTTVASAYALAPFMSSLTNVGTSSSNVLGLTNAFATVYNLVNFATGTVPGTGQPVAGGAPAGLPANIVIPTAEINTLANILSFCVNSDPATTTNCSTLFNAVAVGGVSPTNTLQAALNIAQNPGLFNTTTLFNLASPQAAFAPTLSAAPQDFTIGIQYNGGTATGTKFLNNNGYGIAIDAQGNVYATDSYTSPAVTGPPAVPANTSSYVSKITSAGVYSVIGNNIPSPHIGLNGSWGIAVDLSGSLWVTNTTTGQEALTELDSSGNFLAQATPTSAGGSTNGGMGSGSSPSYIGIDAGNNVWFTNFTANNVSKFTNAAVAISPAAGYTQTMVSGDKPFGIAIDANNNAWVEIQKGTHINQVFGFNAASGAALTGTPYLTTTSATPFTTSPVSNCYGLSLDASGNAWIPSRNTPSIVGVSLTNGALLAGEPTTGYTGGGMAGGALNTSAVDGNGNVWLPNDTGDNIIELVTTGPNVGTFASPTGAGTIGTGGFQKSAGAANLRGIAIDQSGNVWASGNTFVLQIVGAAAPAVQPLALAVKNKTIGQRP